MKKTLDSPTILVSNLPIEIGLQFRHYGYMKQNSIWTVTDILTTTNSKGDVVEIEYATEHMFMGQLIRARVNKTTILRSYTINP